MTRDTTIEIGSALVFCIIALFLLNPMEFWMPTMAHMTMLAVAAIAFGAFATLVLRERVRDEREESHRGSADRAAFLAGSGVLLFAIAVQSLSHAVDGWLVLALLGMVLAKTASGIWHSLYR